MNFSLDIQVANHVFFVSTSLECQPQYLFFYFVLSNYRKKVIFHSRLNELNLFQNKSYV